MNTKVSLRDIILIVLLVNLFIFTVFALKDNTTHMLYLLVSLVLIFFGVRYYTKFTTVNNKEQL